MPHVLKKLEHGMIRFPTFLQIQEDGVTKNTSTVLKVSQNEFPSGVTASFSPDGKAFYKTRNSVYWHEGVIYACIDC